MLSRKNKHNLKSVADDGPLSCQRWPVSQGRGEQIGVFIWSAQSRMTEGSFHQAVSS